MNCKHEHKKDFSCYSFGEQKRIEHEYCPDCKGHFFKGVFWSKEEWEKWINDDPTFDTGSQDKGFNNVKTLGEAKEIFAKHTAPYVDIVQNRFTKQRRWGQEGYDLGIHQYFIDKDGDELGYYTPIMQTVMIFAVPRKVGIKQDLISVG